MKFQDQAVLVTGGGSGIGQAVCYAAAKEGAGVAVGDIDLAKAQITATEIRQRKGEAHAFEIDVTRPDSARQFIADAETALGRLDVLVNSAGVREIVSVLDLAYEEWQRVINVNLTGTFLPSQAFAKRLVDQGKSAAASSIWPPPWG